MWPNCGDVWRLCLRKRASLWLVKWPFCAARFFRTRKNVVVSCHRYLGRSRMCFSGLYVGFLSDRMRERGRKQERTEAIESGLLRLQRLLTLILSNTIACCSVSFVNRNHRKVAEFYNLICRFNLGNGTEGVGQLCTFYGGYDGVRHLSCADSRRVISILLQIVGYGFSFANDVSHSPLESVRCLSFAEMTQHEHT
jgi:hypothetical protein